MNKNRIIKTYTGRNEKRSDCVRIKGQYYFKGDISVKDSGESYFVEGKYHRFNNGLIEYDHNIKKYVLIHKNHLKTGIVDVLDGKPVMGFYTANLTNNVSLLDNFSSSKSTNCISKEIANKLGYRERYADGKFYLAKNSDGVKIPDTIFTKISNKLLNKTSLPYDSRWSEGIVRRVYNQTYVPDEKNKNLNILGDWLETNSITFGVEFETSDGYLAERLCYQYGVLALRDGSIKGLEYVTVPLSGRKGLYTLRDICKKLKERTKFDTSCALHIHVGGLDRKESNILAAFNLGYILQNDSFDLQPYYKRGGTGVYNNGRNKDYCKKISSDIFNSINDKKALKDKFDSLFLYTSDGTSFSRYERDLKKVNNHPSDPKGKSKWNIRSRYGWLNLVPILFTNKKTIEFRHHTSTFDFEKIVNFLIFCSTFVKFAKYNDVKLCDMNSDLVKELKSSKNKLGYIISKALPNKTFSTIISRYNEYNKIRKEVMKKLKDSKDYLGKNESKYDKNYASLYEDDIWN